MEQEENDSGIEFILIPIIAIIFIVIGVFCHEFCNGSTDSLLCKIFGG